MDNPYTYDTYIDGLENQFLDQARATVRGCVIGNGDEISVKASEELAAAIVDAYKNGFARRGMESVNSRPNPEGKE